MIGEVEGGAGGFGVNAASGSGASVLLENAVDGSTAGALALVQRARGGASGTGGIGAGSAGSATSRLAKSAESASLVVVAEAFGGAGLGSVSQAADGGAAVASAEAANGAGSALAGARAVGGAVSPVGSNARGGSAEVVATASTSGDGHDVQVGRPFATDPRLSETGAFGGSAPATGTPLAGGHGGHAQSQSRGIAGGDSAVRVYDLAIGGDARGTPSRTGGSAASQAFGTSQGLATVEVHAWAVGGGGRPGFVSLGGDASAEARAEALGTVVATSLADAATLDTSHGGTGLARAEGVGSAGAATAEARSNGGRFTSTRAIAEAPVVASARAAARADATGVSQPPALDGSADAFSMVAISGEASETWGLAALGLFDTQGVDGDIRLRSEVGFENPSLGITSPDDLVLSFLSIEIATAGFETLHFLVENGELVLVDEVFSDAAGAVDFFDGALTLFAAEEVPGASSSLDLRIALELASAGVGSGFAVRMARDQ